MAVFTVYSQQTGVYFCKNDTDCDENTTCDPENQVCRCKPGYRLDQVKRLCIQSMLGEPCQSSWECPESREVECVRGRCRCKAGWTVDGEDESNTTCRANERGDACSGDEDCNLNSHHLSCGPGGTCECASGYVSDGEHRYCWAARVFETNCTDDYLCREKFGVSVKCSNSGRCECIDFPWQSGYSCIIGMRRLNDECDYHEQCEAIPNSVCSSGKCQCRDHYGLAETVQGRQYCKVLHKGNCSTDRSCSELVSNSFCAGDRKCACKLGYLEKSSADRCVRIAIGSECRSDDDCRRFNGNSYCSKIADSNSFCQCLPGFSLVNYSQFTGQRLVCEKIGLGTHHCTSDRDCRYVNNSVCRSCDFGPDEPYCRNTCADEDRQVTKCSAEVCVCPDEYKKAESGTACEPRILYDTCGKDDNCKTIEGEVQCSNQRCICKPGYRGFANNKCTEITLGDRCRNDEQCSRTTNSVCDRQKFICTCKSGYVPNNQTIGSKQSCRKRRIGEACAVDEDCSNGSQCLRNRCVCPAGFMVGGDLYTCTQRKLYSHCRASQDCEDAISNSTCAEENQTCACLLGFLASGDNASCTLRRLGDHCDTDEDCIEAVGNSRCYWSKTCHCERGYYAMANLAQCEKRQLNDSCEDADDCSTVIGNSTCRDNICTCNNGFEPYSPDTCVRRDNGDDDDDDDEYSCNY
ncbi:multiple epidermal growth factor-like domains 6 [Plakobranchus ocellatus]|uniref:Multiple epidermal growth factor-like domains 6 n=1 Tax=Plakobranchus ocellatus TaxID=259542 RepID=A0AAV3ZWH7_9GAST|nr:multiple epidermal growth factor-like domains 6 [Plakobranchus ocellatus]